MNQRHALIRAAGKLLVVGNDSDPSSIVEYKVDGEREDIWLCSNERYRDQLMSKDFAWPVQAREELIVILTERQKLKKAYDASMGMIYELSNKIARGEVG